MLKNRLQKFNVQKFNVEPLEHLKPFKLPIDSPSHPAPAPMLQKEP
jgi:hypothetical protein